MTANGDVPGLLKKGNWFAVSHDFIGSLRILKPTEVAVCLAILHFQGMDVQRNECWASLKTIAGLIGHKGDRAVQRAVASLEKRGWLTTLSAGHGQVTATRRLTIPPPPDTAEMTISDGGTDTVNLTTQARPDRPPGSGQVGRVDAVKSTTLNKNRIEKMEKEQQQDVAAADASTDERKRREAVTRELQRVGVNGPALQKLSAMPNLWAVHVAALTLDREFKSANNPPGWIIDRIQRDALPSIIPPKNVAELANADRVKSICGQPINGGRVKWNNSGNGGDGLFFADGTKFELQRLTPAAIELRASGPGLE